jgi:methionine synthase II (cobalamin-independent)
MRRATPPFRADHVGSLLRPGRLLRAREQFAAGQLAAQDLRAVEDDAIAEAVRMQEDVGLQAATDGEFRRASWHMDFIDEASRYVPLGQLCLSAQCGFSSTVEGNALSYDEEVAKLRLIVAVARDVWGG